MTIRCQPASSKFMKLNKKTIPHAMVSTTASHGTVLVSGSKTMPGASDLVTVGGHPRSKTIGGTSGSKTTGGVLVSMGAADSKKVVAPIKQRCVPPTGPMAGASLEESQDSSPRGPTIWTVEPEIPLRSEPHGQSPLASVLGPNPPVALQTTTPFGAGGGSTSFCGHSVIAFVCVAK
jgi:hypothetical protein